MTHHVAALVEKTVANRTIAKANERLEISKQWSIRMVQKIDEGLRNHALMIRRFNVRCEGTPIVGLTLLLSLYFNPSFEIIVFLACLVALTSYTAKIKVVFDDDSDDDSDDEQK